METTLENANAEPKIVTLYFAGTEFDYELIDKDDIGDYLAGIYCDSIYDVEIYIDDELIEDETILEQLDGMNQLPVERIELDENIVGIRRMTNKCNYSCEIEVNGDFDPAKLTLNVGWKDLIVGNETISTEVFLNSVTYDNNNFSLEFEDSDGKDSEMIWGYDPNENE